MSAVKVRTEQAIKNIEYVHDEYAEWIGGLHEQLSDLLLEVHKQEEWERNHPITCATIRSLAHTGKGGE